MIATTPAFRTAITGDARKILLRSILDLVSPDIVYGSVTGSAQTAYSQPAQIHDGNDTLTPYATLEPHRWVLDGTFGIAGDGGETGFESSALFDETGSGSFYAETAFSGVTVLQALTILWPDAAYDGYAVDFTVTIKQDGAAVHTITVTDNADKVNVFEGFTVYDPDAVRITVTKWSIPDRRFRLPEVLIGRREEWDNDRLASFSLKQQADFGCTSLPYGTVTMGIDNSDRRFEPRAKSGLFQSIEERQAVQIYIGAAGAEYVPVGTFYQFSGGWKASDNGLGMTWNLVDIVGLLSDRQFTPPQTLPTTLEGWAAALVAQLGVNFANRYHVDPNYASLPMTIADASQISGKTCGQILLWICQASGTWPRADASTGKLTIEPLWSQGNAIDLDNVSQFPTMSANKDVAYIEFTLPDDSIVQIPGTSASSPTTIKIQNPFIASTAAALEAARNIITMYGGNILTTLGRGDPSTEIGDVPTVWLAEGIATTGRVMYQDFMFSDGVMQGCTTQLLQADGSLNYEHREEITESGTWIVPSGVHEIKIILVGGGAGGQRGENGNSGAPGMNGADGLGGLVYAAVIGVNPGQIIPVTVGQGADAYASPTQTVFGDYTSANGTRYTPSYTDVQSGDAYGRSGIVNPAGNGDGGAGGRGGAPGVAHEEKKTTTRYWWHTTGGIEYEITAYQYSVLLAQFGAAFEADVRIETSEATVLVWDTYPGQGQPGSPGANGCAVLYYDVEA